MEHENLKTVPLTRISLAWREHRGLIVGGMLLGVMLGFVAGRFNDVVAQIWLHRLKMELYNPQFGLEAELGFSEPLDALRQRGREREALQIFLNAKQASNRLVRILADDGIGLLGEFALSETARLRKGLSGTPEDRQQSILTFAFIRNEIVKQFPEELDDADLKPGSVRIVRSSFPENSP